MEKFDLGYDLAEAMARTKITAEDLKQLRDPPIPGVPESLTDKQLLLFLNACGTIEAARSCLKMNYDLKRATPEIFNNRDPLGADIVQCVGAQYLISLPMTPDGYSLFLGRLLNTDPSTYFCDAAIKRLLMTFDASLYYSGPTRGLMFIHDLKGISLKHLTRINLRTVRNYTKYVQEALPAKLKEIHIFNVPTFIDKLMYVIKPFLKKEILEMTHFHTHNVNMDDIYKNHVPKSCLPHEYGGDLDSLDVLNDRFAATLASLSDFYKSEEQQRLDSDKDIIKRLPKLDID